MELSVQLHIRPDGPGILTAYYDRKSDQWSEGPSLNEEILRDPEAFEPIVEEILGHVKGLKADSLGVILHLADEFATAELNPELDNPGGLTELRTAAAYEPASILEDTSISASESAFRIVPYAAAGSEAVGTTITISRQYDAMLNVLRRAGENANFPVITQSVSAPLLAILGLPNILKAVEEANRRLRSEGPVSRPGGRSFAKSAPASRATTPTRLRQRDRLSAANQRFFGEQQQQGGGGAGGVNEKYPYLQVSVVEWFHFALYSNGIIL